MTQHTKGPWSTSGVRIKLNGQSFLQVIGPKGIVALVPYGDKTPQEHVESHADANVCAAAPQLLAALREFMDDDDVRALVGNGACERMDALIAAATGTPT